MGTICSRPRTKHDDPHFSPSAQHSLATEHDFKSADSSLNGNLKLDHDDVLLRTQSSAEASELDVVVQQLQQSNQSVTGSAPELLQQWEHDHGVLVRSIDATIQVHMYASCTVNTNIMSSPLPFCVGALAKCHLQAAQNHHRPGQHHTVTPKHVPVHCHSEAPRPLSKLGPGPHPAQQQQAAVPLHTEPLLLQAQQAYRGDCLQLLMDLSVTLAFYVGVSRVCHPQEAFERLQVA